jgi:hypothetical protein
VLSFEHQRNVEDCRKGEATCTFSDLSKTENADFKKRDHDRNLKACTEGRGYCDRTRLTTSELKSLPDSEAESPK